MFCFPVSITVFWVSNLYWKQSLSTNSKGEEQTLLAFSYLMVYYDTLINFLLVIIKDRLLKNSAKPQISRTARNCRNQIETENLRVKMMDEACISPYPAHVFRKRVESFVKSDTLCKNVLTFHTFDGILILARKEVPPHVRDRVR